MSRPPKKARGRPPRDLTNRRFGALTALHPTVERVEGNVVWACDCDCGRKTKVPMRNLTSGNTRSCGCLRNVRMVGRDIRSERENLP